MKFPEREQRHHSDIFAGLMFYFVRNPNLKDGEKPLFTDPDPAFFDHDVPWLVLGKEFVDTSPSPHTNSYWRFLLLGPGPTLKWHVGHLGWIRRVADPVWEERERSGYWDRHDAEVKRALDRV